VSAQASIIVQGATLDDLVERVASRTLEALREARVATGQDADGPLLLTCNRLCKRLGLSRATIFRLRGQGLPCFKVGDEYRYELEPVVAWLRARGSPRA
jgi:hypothetical protein